MRTLTYSGGALIKRVAIAPAALPIVAFIAFDPDIDAGHVRGLWMTILYEIGPTGRYIVCGVVTACVLFAACRSLALFAGDRIALCAETDGLAVRTAMERRQLPWVVVRHIAVESRRVRGRSYSWVRIDTTLGDSEKAMRVSTAVLGADPAAIDRWVTDACVMLAESRRPAPVTLPVDIRSGFGRRVSARQDHFGSRS